MTGFYLACFRDNVGSNIGWHGLNGKGYTTNVDQAHIYTLEQAQIEWDNARSIDQPIAVHHVRKNIIWKVDYQYIPSGTQINDPYIVYVALEKDALGPVCDGNDVYWLNLSTGKSSTDFSTATKLRYDQALSLKDRYILLPFDIADAHKRPTFPITKFNLKQMVIEEGLIEPMRRSMKRKRSLSGKTRMQCPECGKFVWQDNSYDFTGCIYESCK